MTTAAIRTDRLSKTYGPVRALDGLTLSVDEGTVFGFLGPNGAGKTTTIRLLTGLAHPTSGTAWVAGQSIGSGPALASIIGYLPEQPSFYPWMTAMEYLDYVGRLFGLDGRERARRSGELLERMGLSSACNRRIGGFSRGMRQRLGLAQALINRPRVLFLDEPVSALDPAGRKEVLEMIQELRGSMTVFMSTHILQDVERVCDTVGIINQGRLVVTAPRAELLARYSLPAFEVECVEGEEATLHAWANSLSTLAWVASATVQGTVARIIVRDVAVAQRQLLAEVARSGLTVKRYEIVTPSLEDVFLRLVNGDGGRA